MILLPVLIALILFCVGEIATKKVKESQTGGSASETAAASDLTREGPKQAGEGNSTGSEPIQGNESVTTEAGAETFGEIPAPEPMQKIAFRTVDKSKEHAALQRSVPVQIDSSILGGEQWVNCWAVFIPAEMAENPEISLSGYKSVTMRRLEEGEYLDGARLGPESGGKETKAAGDEMDSSADKEAHTYLSGDQIPGLENGSAFSVELEEEDGSVYSDILYVFTCSDTATMYLDTKSGSMETVNADPTKAASEEANFMIFTPDGSADSAGACLVSGRGNSSWKMSKRPYNVNLTEKQSILGMSACRKLCLLSNSFDTTNLLDRISSRIALELGMRDTPEGEFVNLYLNGQYNGLYYLSQRPRTGGSVHIDKLDNRILEANGLETYTEVPGLIALHQEGDRQKKWAYEWPNEPKDNTGGYLLQQYSRYEGVGSWFSTVHRRFRIMSPSYPTVGQVNYISDYILSVERAIYSEDGKDPQSGKHYSKYLDIASWQDMYLLEEYFVEWDAERRSFYIIKDRKNPLLYCGPMWDFDHSAGTMLYGTYPETAVSTLLLRDNRHGWLDRLLSHEEFEEELHDRWRERFSPAIHNFLDKQMEKEIAAIESAAYMNNIRRMNDIDYRKDTDRLTTWLQRRAAFLDSYVGDKKDGGGADQYDRVLYQFTWGDLSHYVPHGRELGYLPLPEYGETQVSTQIEKNEIIGWKDEDGNMISADIVINRDRTFTPEYK